MNNDLREQADDIIFDSHGLHIYESCMDELITLIGNAKLDEVKDTVMRLKYIDYGQASHFIINNSYDDVIKAIDSLRDNNDD